MWAAPLLGGARAVVLFNRHVSSDEKFDEHNMTLHWSMVGLPEDMEVRTGLKSRLHALLGCWEAASIGRAGLGWHPA